MRYSKWCFFYPGWWKWPCLCSPNGKFHSQSWSHAGLLLRNIFYLIKLIYFVDDLLLQELQSFTVTFRSEEVKSNKDNFVMAWTSDRRASLSHALFRRRKNTILWRTVLVQFPNGSRYLLRLEGTENDVWNFRPCESPLTHKEEKSWYYCRYFLSSWTVLSIHNSIHILTWHAFR